MDGYVFVNKAFSKAVEDYLASKTNPESVQYNSFFVNVIKLLAMIYDELDILNPYYLNNEKILYNNLEKYGYSKEKVMDFLQNLNNFATSENATLFLEIQKNLVDMLGCKRNSLNLSNEELDKFKVTLYSSQSQNPLQVSYNFMMLGTDEILDYFENMLNNSAQKEVTTKPKEMLSASAYEILKYSMEDINSMDENKLNEVNKNVYNYFDINENAINRKYLLDKAVDNFNKPVSQAGFVDIVFILAIILIVVLVILIVTFIIL